MLMAVLPVYSYEKVKRFVELNESQADGFELRWDYASHFHYAIDIRKLTKKPLIYTLRSISHGGLFSKNNIETWKIIQSLCETKPDYIDLEFDMPYMWFEAINEHYPDIKIICSYHDTDNQNLSINTIYQSIEHLPFHILKIAKYCDTGFQGLELVDEMLNGSYPKPRVMIGMGECGQFTRVLGPIMGNYFDYASIDSKHCVAPGQLSIQELLEVYHYRNLNLKTRIYALLGHPVHQSIGHEFHNAKFIAKGRNAVYVKIDIDEKDLKSALEQIKRLPIDGLSLTMPLKKIAVNYLNTNLSAVNTIKCDNDMFLAFNTDGEGALHAFHSASKKLKVLILGAGGAADAIAHSFIKAGHQVYLLHRDINKAKQLKGIVLDPSDPNLPTIDAVINTLPPHVFDDNQMWGNDLLNLLQSNHIVMDINYYMDSIFLKKAKSLGCKIIPGIDMFYYQAQEQQKIWFNS